MYWNLSEETHEERNNSLGRLAQESNQNEPCDNAEIRQVLGQSSPQTSDCHGEQAHHEDLAFKMAITNATSPKAKLRCCENVPLHCRGNRAQNNPQTCQSTSSNDWQQNFNQDCFWMPQQTKTAVINKNDFDALGTSKHEQRTNHRPLHSATEVCFDSILIRL